MVGLTDKGGPLNKAVVCSRRNSILGINDQLISVRTPTTAALLSVDDKGAPPHARMHDASSSPLL